MKRRKGRFVAGFAGIVLAVLIGFCWPRMVAWYEFFSLFESLGKNEQGYSEYRHRQTGIVMVWVPGGTFWMGSAKEEEEQIISEYARYAGRKRSGGAKYILVEQPRHQVTVRPFLIAKYELRQSIWSRFGVSRAPFRFKGDDFPATSITWDACREFSERTGLRFPSEAQWEYACRAGTTTPFSFGESVSTDQANFDGNCPYGNGQIGEYRQKPVAVGALKPNGFGLYNMHGNVLEWCEDVFERDFYSKPEARRLDPLCDSGSENRVFRGGGWVSDAWFCRSARRGWGNPAEATDTVGFRPAYYPLP